MPTRRRGKKSMPAAERLGHSRGCFSIKLREALDALGNSLRRVLTPGHWADCMQLLGLLAELRHAPGADKVYDINPL